MDANPLGALGSLLGGAVSEAVGLLGKLTGQGSPTSGGRFVVNHDNVLAAAKIIQSQVDSLKDALDAAQGQLTIDPPGDDDVSKPMADAWNAILVTNGDSYATRVREYIEGLDKLVEQLKGTAKDYGYNEDQIIAALGGARVA